jgi:hypothetical protein
MTGYRIEMPRMLRDLIRHLPPAVKAKIKAALKFIFDDPYRAKELRDDLAGCGVTELREYGSFTGSWEREYKSSHLDPLRISMSVQPPNSARRCEHANPLTGNKPLESMLALIWLSPEFGSGRPAPARRTATSRRHALRGQTRRHLQSHRVLH